MTLNMRTLPDIRHTELRAVFESPTLVTRLDASYDGSFVPTTQSWAEYWQPVERLGNSLTSGAVQKLKGAWQNYVASSFHLSLAKEYCFRYFSLLDATLSARRDSSLSSPSQRALEAVLGFECFTVNGGMCGPANGAAGRDDKEKLRGDVLQRRPGSGVVVGSPDILQYHQEANHLWQ
ncbi:MAG: hypothetical protein ABSG55_10895 [Dehalococcoidia bacterium]